MKRELMHIKRYHALIILSSSNRLKEWKFIVFIDKFGENMMWVIGSK